MAETVLTPAQVLLDAIKDVPKPRLKARDPEDEESPDQVHRAIRVPREPLIEALEDQAKAFSKLTGSQKKAAKKDIALVTGVLRSAKKRSGKPTATLERTTVDALIAILKPAPLPKPAPTSETEEDGDDENPGGESGGEE